MDVDAYMSSDKKAIELSNKNNLFNNIKGGESTLNTNKEAEWTILMGGSTLQMSSKKVLSIRVKVSNKSLVDKDIILE